MPGKARGGGLEYPCGRLWVEWTNKVCDKMVDAENNAKEPYNLVFQCFSDTLSLHASADYSAIHNITSQFRCND